MSSTESANRLQRSAGGIVYRSPFMPSSAPWTGNLVTTDGSSAWSPVGPLPSNERLEVALISVGRYHRWQLPKGTIEAGESREEAALREVREETGLHAELLSPIGTIEYWFSSREHGHWVRFHKYVHFYLMRFISGDVSLHDHEVNEARWFDIHEAVRLLAFDNERTLISRALEVLTPPSLELNS